MMRTTLLFILISLNSLHAQELKKDSVRIENEIQKSILAKQSKIARVGLIGLSSWAVGNMLVGGIGMANSSGELRSFHEMNFYFNTVNLAIGGLGILTTYKSRPSDFRSLLNYQTQMEKVYLFNMGLDLVYMTSGWAIYNKGLSQTGDKASQSFGYGKSLVLQGGFLLMYDVIMHSAFKRIGKGLNNLWPALEVNVTGTGIRLSHTFN